MAPASKTRRVAKSLRLEPLLRPRHGDTGALRPRPPAAPGDLGGAALHAAERRLQEAQRLEERGASHLEGVRERRVALRRLRAALELLGLGGDARRVHALQEALGAVRDLQLQLEPPAISAALAHSLRRRLDMLEEVARAWRAEGVPRLAQHVHALSGRGVPGGRVRSRLARDAKRLVKALGAVEADLPPDEAHRARIAVRRLRDDLEIVGPEALDAAGLLRRLVTIQAALGAVRDHDVGAALRSADGQGPRPALVDRAHQALRGCAAAVQRLRAAVETKPARGEA